MKSLIEKGPVHIRNFKDDRSCLDMEDVVNYLTNDVGLMGFIVPGSRKAYWVKKKPDGSLDVPVGFPQT